MSHPYSSSIILALNPYQAANLHWFLAIARGPYAAVCTDKNVEQVFHHLQTGDWTGELLWMLEDQMQKWEDTFKTPMQLPNKPYPVLTPSWESMSELQRAVRNAVKP